MEVERLQSICTLSTDTQKLLNRPEDMRKIIGISGISMLRFSSIHLD